MPKDSLRATHMEISPWDRVHATHLEIRAINSLMAGLKCKNINHQQITNEEFLLNALQPELDSLSAALSAQAELKNCHGVDVLKLCLTIGHARQFEGECWDLVEIMWPLNHVLMNLREEHATTALCWRNRTGFRTYKDVVIALVQMLWLGVHPFR